jgi:hypothetical protein
MAKYYSQIDLMERARAVAPRVRFLDVVIDGRPLMDIEEIAELDTVSRFDFADLDAARKCVSDLTPDDFVADSRAVLLYVCPLCGDVGCGAVQVRVSRSADDFDWGGFFYVNGIDDPKPLAIGPFKFEAEAYLKTMRDVLDRLGRLEGPFLPEKPN